GNKSKKKTLADEDWEQKLHSQKVNCKRTPAMSWFLNIRERYRLSRDLDELESKWNDDEEPEFSRRHMMKPHYRILFSSGDRFPEQTESSNLCVRERNMETRESRTVAWSNRRGWFR
ncbi:MAG: hypothetical protein Q9181_008181, partial [Wetmoreana brouardii]